MEFNLFILVLLFIINAKNSYAKNGKIRPTFAEIFGQEWENEKIEFETENNQNSNWQNENELNSADSNGSDQNNDQLNDQQKLKIVHKFHTIKEGIRKRGKYLPKIWNKIEQKIAKKLGINRNKIYEWKKEFGLSRKIKINEKNYYEKKKKEFIERIDEFKRMYKNGKQKQFAKELGIGEDTFYNWKKEFGIEIGKRNRYSNEEKTNKMTIYYKMKKSKPSLSDQEIAGFLKISQPTLSKWKKQNRQSS